MKACIRALHSSCRKESGNEIPAFSDIPERQAQFSTRRPILITFFIENTTDETYQLLTWATPGNNAAPRIASPVIV